MRWRGSSSGWRRRTASRRATSRFTWASRKFDDKTEEQLREIVKRGISSFKIFLAYKGAFGIDDTELYQHAEAGQGTGRHRHRALRKRNARGRALQKELLAEGKTDPGQHHESRPPRVEAEGVHHLMTFAELTGAARLHRASQLPARRWTQRIAARQRGVRVWIETLIQYLVLDKTYAEKPNFEGAKYVMSPPLRDKRNQECSGTACATD